MKLFLSKTVNSDTSRQYIPWWIMFRSKLADIYDIRFHSIKEAERIIMEEYSKKPLVIIPDVHGRSFWRTAVKAHPYDEYVFLGDYLDPYPDEGISQEEAFNGLIDITDFKQRNPDRVTLLWGNHDLHYLYPEMMGSRYDIRNARRNVQYFWDHQSLFKMAYETKVGEKRYLFSHAGVGRGWLEQSFTGTENVDITAELFNTLIGYPPFMDTLGDMSALRGGRKAYGSMIWADVEEHLMEQNQYPDIVQVFGHSMVGKPLNIEDRVYCLDCSKAFILDRVTGQITNLDGVPITKEEL